MYTKKIEKLDVLLIILVIGLAIFGIVAIGSATHINLPGVEPTVYKSQIRWLILGIFLMAAATVIDYEFFGKFYLIAYFALIVLLVLTLFTEERNGATRWIEIFGFRLQPSEFAKIILTFCMAKLISANDEKINNPLVVIIIITMTLIPDFLVFKQPSLSVSLVILAIVSTQLFIGGISYKYVIAFFAVLLPVFTLFMIDIRRPEPVFADEVLEEYHINRILALERPEDFPDEAYQSQKSITALGSGQLDGKGLYEGTLNRVSALPEQHNDFIFTVIGEEFGFQGCVIVLAVLFMIILRCVIIALKAYDMFGKLIAVGVAAMFTFQTFVHCGVAMAFLPTTGMGLPFLSYGGSSLWTNMIAIGLVLNVGMKQPKSFFEGG